MDADTKVVCGYWRCGWCGPQSELLRAPDPFNPGEEITCCPKCRDPSNGIITACDFDGCTEEASSGTPTPDGYKHRCYTHRIENRRTPDGGA